MYPSSRSTLRRSTWTTATAAVVFALACLVAGCGTGAASRSTVAADSRSGPIAVVASTNVWGDVASQIGGDHVEVTSVISKPDADPHSYEADAGTALTLSKAHVVVENGGGYDDFMDRMLASTHNDSAVVLNAVEISGHRAADGAELNEHVWYDIPTVAKVADRLATAFGKLQPEHRAQFTANARTFDAGLAGLERSEAAIRRAHTGEGAAITEPVPRLPPGRLRAGRPHARRVQCSDRERIGRAGSRPGPDAGALRGPRGHRSRLQRPDDRPADHRGARGRDPRRCRRRSGHRDTAGRVDLSRLDASEPERRRRGTLDVTAHPLKPVLRIRGGELRFGPRTLWHHLDLEVAEGEFVALIGGNGTGKTSLLKAILGLQPLSAGTIDVDGRAARRGSDRIGYVPQERRIEPPVPIRVRDLVGLGLDGAHGGLGRHLGRSARDRRRRIDDALASVGAGELAGVDVRRLSGGEQQRVRIAQALSTDPSLLLCDEPLLSLDVAHQDLVVRLIDQRRRTHGTAVLFVTHEINPVLPCVDRVLYVANGRIAVGSVDEVMTSATLSALYGSPVEVIRTGGRILVVGVAPTGGPSGDRAGAGRHS